MTRVEVLIDKISNKAYDEFNFQVCEEINNNDLTEKEELQLRSYFIKLEKGSTDE